MKRFHAAGPALLLALTGAMPADRVVAADVDWHGAEGAITVLAPRAVRDDVPELHPGDRGVLPSTGWVSVLGYELRGRAGPYLYDTSTTSGAQWCTGDEQFADAKLELPHNVRLDYFRIWGYDNSTRNVGGILMRSCLPTFSAASEPANTALATLETMGTPGGFSLSTPLDPIVTDTMNCTYYVRARFGFSCGGAGAGDTTFRKARVQYSLLP